MKRILVATDFSSRSLRGLLRAALLAKGGSGVLTIVHVVDDDQPKQIVDREVAAADEFLREQIGSLPELRGADCHPRVVTGDPFEGILGTAGAMAADLIVMGTHRKQLLRDVLVGTTIERVIRTGPCPVLMVNRQADHPYGSVLAPVDMSDASAHALKTADALGFLDGVRTTVAHAFLAAAKGKLYVANASREQIAEYVADEQRQAEKEVGVFLDANGFLDRGWPRHVREGSALEVIPVAVETMRPDLIVVGTHGRSKIARIFIGSVTESLLRTLETDILAVPRAPLAA
jgi:nucleotide-binding universal stress UspA family protein